MYLALKLVHVFGVVLFLGNITVEVLWNAWPMAAAIQSSWLTRWTRSSKRIASLPFPASSFYSLAASALLSQAV